MKFFAVLATILAVGSALPSSWTLQDLSAALTNPNTDPAIIPILEEALNNLYAAIHAGQDVESILVPIPGIVPGETDLTPSPAIPLPEPVAAPRSPLVQVIVNVNKQTQQITEVPMPESPAIVPSPVDVIDVSPVDIIDVSPVDVIDVAPVDVIPSPIEVNPAPAPVVINPIDVIAINPEPVGVLEPSPAVVGPIIV
ncbi:resuscitation-promoting factor RpfA-like [Colias croceus]|uniref:resuscitation-promoting factor RpfA-like n=1 Tax=Colias crocea TaxID=72248 RepID=UPI001E2811B3|nr:resuscitation-promoting factor RpfA-like [Colias croceus]